MGCQLTRSGCLFLQTNNFLLRESFNALPEDLVGGVERQLCGGSLGGSGGRPSTFGDESVYSVEWWWVFY